MNESNRKKVLKSAFEKEKKKNLKEWEDGNSQKHTGKRKYITLEGYKRLQLQE